MAHDRRRRARCARRDGHRVRADDPLTQATLTQATLTQATLTQATLTQATLTQAALTPLLTLTLTQTRYDPTTLAPLGMVVSRDELMGRKVPNPSPDPRTLALALGP